MARPKISRRVRAEPNVTYFKPAGVRLTDLEESVLTVDEFEAVRLSDLEGLNQEDCAKRMRISQPTFHRLIVSARKKIADSVVNGKAIKIEGGNYKLVRRMGDCFCQSCGYKKRKIRGVPCVKWKCPKCGKKLVRGD